MRRRFPHLIRVTVMGEDLPQAHNRVEIDPNLKNTSGIPAPRVVHSDRENSLRMLVHGARMARQSLEAAGTVEILDSELETPAYHLMGTARMGTDPGKSVVNASHRAHDVKNLYIVDGSSFARGGQDPGRARGAGESGGAARSIEDTERHGSNHGGDGRSEIHVGQDVAIDVDAGGDLD
jgi:choline dehydrogenase-like flavoprotein